MNPSKGSGKCACSSGKKNPTGYKKPAGSGGQKQRRDRYTDAQLNQALAILTASRRPH